MNKIKKDQYMVTYDEELGIIYAPMKGTIKTTTPEHAQAIDNCLTDYFNNQLNSEDMTALETYLEKYFGKLKDLPTNECPNLIERNVLRRLELILANDCNLRCKYCYAHCGDYGMKAERLSPEKALIYLQKLLIGKYRYVEIVTLFGGEPTLCPSTMKTVCEFFESNVKSGMLEKMPIFLMVSNGTLIDEEIVELVHKYNIRVTISIDGPQDINDMLRVDAAGNGTYLRIARGIKLLKEAGNPPVLLEATYTTKHEDMGYSKEDIQNILKKEFQVKKVMVADCCDGGIEEDLAHIDWSVHIKDRHEDIFNADIGHTYNSLVEKVYSPIGCDVGYGSVSLIPNGELYPCHFFVNHSEYQIGYYHDGFFDFSNYENMLIKLYGISKIKNARCKDCWAKVVCLSCPAKMLLENNQESIDADCYTRKIIEKHMILKCAKLNLRKV